MTTPDELEQAKRLDLASQFLDDPRAAHAIIFKDDNEDKDAPFHEELIRLYHGADPFVIALCFRGSGKSTKAERCIALLAAAGTAKNVIIVGENWNRAVERLQSIRRILQSNVWLRYLYGDATGEVEGDTWRETRLVLRSDSIVWALGQGQAVRGTRHGAYRPDWIFVDDLEDADSVATPEARDKLRGWFWKDLLPIRAKDFKLRVAATPLHPDSLAVNLVKHPQFKSLIVPIDYVDEEGVRRPSWPGAFPLERVDSIKSAMIDAGAQAAYATEYQVQAIDPATKLFKREMFRFEPIVRTWHPVFIAIDPARTDKKTSATTGIVAASYIGRRIIVWEAVGPRILPDALVDRIFAMEAKYEPVAIGVERDGLEQFIMQPLRHEQIKRGCLLPIRELKAPRDKDGFIGRLQPLLANGDVTFAGTEADFRDAIAQFMDFPNGLKDVPNAMAYLETLRGGIPVYEDCSAQHILEGAYKQSGHYTLAVNAGGFGTTAVLFQYSQGVLLLHKDWRSGDLPGHSLSPVVEEARLYCGRDPAVVAPPFHFDVRNSYGLLASLKGVAAIRKGGDIVRGREFIRDLLRREVRGIPKLSIGEEASWTRRAMCGGFVWDTGRQEPREGLYRTLMEGLEAAMAVASYQAPSVQPIAYTPDGIPYQTSEVKYHLR